MIVYIIVNKITKSYYIGITNGNRKSYFGSGVALKDAISKYGKGNFRKITIETCKDRIIASEREKYWIKTAKSKWTNRKCLNLTDGGENGYTISKNVTDKTRLKLIQYYKDHPELKDKLRNHARNTLVKYIKENGNPNIKITSAQKIEIINSYTNYELTGVELSEKYNVSPSCIHLIVRDHLRKGCNGSGNGMAKLNERDILKIRELVKTLTITNISLMYNVSQPTVSNIINRKTWTHV